MICPSLQPASRNFYPRPPRGGRHEGCICTDLDRLFLSTPSARRATTSFLTGRRPHDISIHALREEGDSQCHPYRRHSTSISIHALREEGDMPFALRSRAISTFLSTPSARRATAAHVGALQPGAISIHALREEGDLPTSSSAQTAVYFYPRPPRGGRRTSRTEHRQYKQFLSTPSARRATCRTTTALVTCGDFYPRPPRGGRLALARLLQGA